MLLQSEQLKIVQDVALTFQKGIKTSLPIIQETINKDRIHLPASKYSSFSKADFMFIVLWTVFKMNTSKVKTLQILRGYTKNDLIEIDKEKIKFLLYKDTISNDIKVMESIEKRDDIVHRMYTQNKISLFYWYIYFKDKPLSRIRQKTKKNTSTILLWFPGIVEYLENIKDVVV